MSCKCNTEKGGNCATQLLVFIFGMYALKVIDNSSDGRHGLWRLFGILGWRCNSVPFPSAKSVLQAASLTSPIRPYLWHSFSAQFGFTYRSLTELIQQRMIASRQLFGAVQRRAFSASASQVRLREKIPSPLYKSNYEFRNLLTRKRHSYPRLQSSVLLEVLDSHYLC